MFYKMIIATLLTASVAKAAPCSEEILSAKALQAAKYLEFLNGGGETLTEEIYSLSSQFDTYVAILSYSGVQHSWKIKVDSQECLVKSVQQ